MTEKLARKLVDNYVTGWRDADAERILSCLTQDCLVIESHGPTYHGLDQVKRWIDEWHQTGKVNRWDINSFFFTQDAAFFQWSFTCTIDGDTDDIEGASIVQFKSDKIHYIHEYRMTEPAFDYFSQ